MAWKGLKAWLSQAGPAPPVEKTVWRDATQVEDKIRSALATLSGVPPGAIKPETAFVELDDSVGNLEIIMQCEEEFDLEISNEDAELLETVGQLTAYVQKRLGLAPGMAPERQDEGGSE